MTQDIPTPTLRCIIINERTSATILIGKGEEEPSTIARCQTADEPKNLVAITMGT
jgi:hypothetical protein